MSSVEGPSFGRETSRISSGWENGPITALSGFHAAIARTSDLLGLSRTHLVKEVSEKSRTSSSFVSLVQFTSAHSYVGAS
jgi:hypothetical protein